MGPGFGGGGGHTKNFIGLVGGLSTTGQSWNSRAWTRSNNINLALSI